MKAVWPGMGVLSKGLGGSSVGPPLALYTRHLNSVGEVLTKICHGQEGVIEIVHDLPTVDASQKVLSLSYLLAMMLP